MSCDGIFKKMKFVCIFHQFLCPNTWFYRKTGSYRLLVRVLTVSNRQFKNKFLLLSPNPLMLFIALVGPPRPSIQPYRLQYLSNSNQLRLDQIWLLYTIDTASDRLVFEAQNHIWINFVVIFRQYST